MANESLCSPLVGLWTAGCLSIVVFVGGCSGEATREANQAATFLTVAQSIKVPSFSLTQRSGNTVTLSDLLGKVWVADFIFTTCSGPCPQLSLRMRSLQSGIREFGGKVRVVSFSVDPEHDTPAVLRAYAKRYGAEDDLWWFLTTDDQKTMHELVTAGFLQALSPAKGGSPIIHTTRFVLVDRKGRIRGWYDGMSPVSKSLILRDIEKLLSEPTG